MFKSEKERIVLIFIFWFLDLLLFTVFTVFVYGSRDDIVRMEDEEVVFGFTNAAFCSNLDDNMMILFSS